MSSETSKPDPNYYRNIMGLSLGGTHDPTNVWVDETTHRLLVSAVITSNTATSSMVSTNNSSTATLLSGATFTGTADDVTTYSEIRVSVFSDVASATDGLSIQQSINGTNWDIVDTYTIAAGAGKTFVVPRQAQFARVVYTNGGTNQAAFRLSVILNRSSSSASSQRASDGYTNETDLVQQQSFGMVYDSAGNQWYRAKQIANGIQGVGINDGTNTANILKPDRTAAGQNAVLTAGTYNEMGNLTAGSLNAFLVPSTDVSNYRWFSLQVTGTWSGTMTFQVSNDNVNFNTFAVPQSGNVTTAASNTFTQNATYQGPIMGRYIRVQMTSYVSGTANGTLELYTNTGQLQTIGVAAVQSGTWNVGLNTQGPIVDGSGSTNGSINLQAFNGSTLDRVRSATAADSTTGTGLLGAGILSWDGTNYQRLGQAANTSDTLTTSLRSLPVLAQNLLYNGSNQERQRANTTASVIAAGATSSNAGVTVTTYNATKAVVIVNIASATAATLTVTINAVTSSGYVYPLLVSTALATVAVTPLRIFPGAAASANASANDMVPRSLQVVTVVTGTISYGIDINLGT